MMVWGAWRPCQERVSDRLQMCAPVLKDILAPGHRWVRTADSMPLPGWANLWWLDVRQWWCRQYLADGTHISSWGNDWAPHAPHFHVPFGGDKEEYSLVRETGNEIIQIKQISSLKPNIRYGHLSGPLDGLPCILSSTSGLPPFSYPQKHLCTMKK